MVRCVECGTSDDFDFGDGTGYCRICGTQSQDIREEVAEFDVTLFGSNQTTRRVATAANSSRLAPAPQQIWTVAEALQFILLEQTDALLKHGIPYRFRNTVGNLWLKFLAKIGTIRIPGIEEVMLFPPYKISIYDNLVILYLALRLIQYPILVSDIIKWIATGIICFYHAHYRLPVHFKPRKLLISAFHVVTIPTGKLLSERIDIMIEILDIALPPVSLMLASNSVTESCKHFSANREILHTTMGMLHLYFTQFSLNAYKLDIVIAAALLQSFRIHYQFENSLIIKDGWMSWFQSYVDNLLKKSVHNSVQCPTRNSPTPLEQYYLNLPLAEYLRETDVVMGHLLSRHHMDVHLELKAQFDGEHLPPSHSQPVLDILGSLNKALMAQPTQSTSKNNTVKRKNKYNKHPQFKRELAIYPLNEIIADCTFLPLEFEMLLKDVASYFVVDFGDAFKEIQKMAQLTKL